MNKDIVFHPFLTLEEALAWLVDDKEIEVQFINEPNTGITRCIKASREEAVTMLRAAQVIWVSGPEGQRTNFGMHISVQGILGTGDMFFPTKPSHVNN